jgi:ubiquinone/menaquinone biosynthesis C-methylase UbiE
VSESEFDEYADRYDDTVQRAISASGESVQFFAALKAKLMAATLQSAGQRPAKVLDFGCGIGNSTRELAAALPTSHLVGVDPSSESIVQARAFGGGDRIAFQVVDGNQLPFPDGTFDSAFAACVFHHIEGPQRAHWASEIRRVVRAGGDFFLFEHNPYNPLTRRVVANVPFDEGVELLTAHETSRLLKEAGFESEAPTFYFFFPHFLKALRFAERWLRRVPLGGQYFVRAVNRRR